VRAGQGVQGPCCVRACGRNCGAGGPSKRGKRSPRARSAMRQLEGLCRPARPTVGDIRGTERGVQCSIHRARRSPLFPGPSGVGDETDDGFG
jgi:hypothetical protein